jgi:polyisoprenoid-binding protein YceI
LNDPEGCRSGILIPKGAIPLRTTVLILLLIWPLAAGAVPWQIESGTTVSVDVRWRKSLVVVRFPTVTGQIDFNEEHPETAHAAIEVSTENATTGIPPADSLVRSEGYLAAARFPHIRFDLQRLNPTSRNTADIFGTITFRGVTRPIAFLATVILYGPDPNAPERFRAGFDITGRIDRTAFGSEAGLPDVPAELPIRIRLLISSL